MKKCQIPWKSWWILRRLIGPNWGLIWFACRGLVGNNKFESILILYLRSQCLILFNLHSIIQEIVSKWHNLYYYNFVDRVVNGWFTRLTENLHFSLSLIELKLSIYHELQGKRTVRSDQIWRNIVWRFKMPRDLLVHSIFYPVSIAYSLWVSPPLLFFYHLTILWAFLLVDLHRHWRVYICRILSYGYW